MRALIDRFASDQSGATAIEYALIATLVSVAIVLGATALGGQLGVVFQVLADKVEAAGEPSD
jgi:pilus assembly protein Flp/PilA